MKNYNEISLLLCCLAIFVIPGSTETKKEMIQKYLKETLDNPNYDKRIVPDGEGGPDTPVEVNVTIFLFDINRLNEENMEFEAQMFLRQSWTDPRLKYNISGVNKIILTDVDKIWTPNLYFIDEKEGSLHEVTQRNILCKIKPDGNVFYSMKLSQRHACQMNFRKFPHDTQECKITLESYGYTREEVVLKWPSDRSAGIGVGSVNFPFEFQHLNKTEYNIKLTSGEYTVLSVILSFKRNIGFFVKKMHTPLAFLVLLSWLSFWIRPEENMQRMVLLLVILYRMVAIISDLDRWIPYTPYTKASDVWIGCCETLLFATLLENIFVVVFFRIEHEVNNSCEMTEMSTSFDNEFKEYRPNSFRSYLNQLTTVIREGRRGSRFSSHPIDRISRFAFPIFFFLFNVVYWSIYGFS